MITQKNINASGGSVSPIRALINSPGVELQQQTGQRINIALRGSSGVFSTNVFPMLDYRSLISPGLEYSIVPGHPEQSILLYRIDNTEPGIMMPEIGRSINHNEGVDLISEYIKNLTLVGSD